MAYNRMWFKKDLFGLTLGGGQMNNPGRYLTLLPPINRATAVTGTPYFTENPGDKAHGFDGTVTLDYMPKQFLTFRWEAGYRHFDVPYWTGRGGITPPGDNNGSPQQYACTVTGPGGNSASGFTSLAPAQAYCGSRRCVVPGPENPTDHQHARHHGEVLTEANSRAGPWASGSVDLRSISTIKGVVRRPRSREQ
jgi:hypothetical protein